MVELDVVVEVDAVVLVEVIVVVEFPVAEVVDVSLHFYTPNLHCPAFRSLACC